MGLLLLPPSTSLLPSVDTLVVVLLLPAPGVQLLVGFSSQMSINTDIVLGPHIQLLVQCFPPCSRALDMCKFVGLFFCSLLSCCPAQFNGATSHWGLSSSLCDFYIPLLYLSPQHHHNDDHSSEAH